MGRARLVFLTGRTSVDVVFREFFYSSAFVCLAKEVHHVGNAMVFCKHFFIVILPLVNTKGSGQEVGWYMMLARNVLKFKVKLH